MSTFTAKVIEVDGELVLEFPDGMMEELGWEIGDTLIWTRRCNGVWELSKKTKQEE